MTSSEIYSEISESPKTNLLLGLIIHPKKTFREIFFPKQIWNRVEMLVAGIMLLLEVFIFQFMIYYWFTTQVNFISIWLQTSIVFLLLLIPSPILSRSPKSMIVWHVVILSLPSMLSFVLLLIMVPFGFIDHTTGLQIYESTMIMIVLFLVVLWAMIWKLFGYLNLFRKEPKIYVKKCLFFELADILLATGYFIYFFYHNPIK